MPPTHVQIRDEIVEAIYFFGGQFPLEDFSQLWNSILDRFLESLIKLQEILSSLLKKNRN